MKKLLIFIYGIFAYLIGFSTLVYFIFYIGGWNFIPFNIDSGTPQSLTIAISINLFLVIIFGLHHSIAARQFFKDKITKVIPLAAERSTYVLISGILLFLLYFYWQKIDGYLWQIENTYLSYLIIFIYFSAWIFSTIGSFLINHFELFGLQQVYLNLINKPEPEVGFTDRYFYKFVRHPIQAGTLVGIWATPEMSYTHLMLSVTFTIYIFIGLYYEEKDLLKELGNAYKEYQNRVSMIIPFIK